MDDHHGYLEHKFHEETAASNDQHSLTSIQRHSISVINPNERHREQMKQFQREQQQLDVQFKKQQDKLNEKFKTYKKLQQKEQQKEIHQLQVQKQQIEQMEQQMQYQMQQQMQQQIEQQMKIDQKKLDSQSIDGHFGQKMFSDYARPFYPSEHQHQSILTLQTHLLPEERFKSSKNIIPEFKPIANIKSIPIEHQQLQSTRQLYPVNMDQQIEVASSNVEPVAIDPSVEATDKSSFRINVADSEQLPKPEALTMDANYQFQPQTDYNMFHVFQIQPFSQFQSETQSSPLTVS